MQQTKNFLLLFLLFACCILRGQTQEGDICGYWRTLKGNAQMEVYKENDGSYSAKVVWLRIEKDRPDINNEDKSLKNRKILGLQILSGLKFDKKQNKWEDGKIYDPQTGKTYHCSVTLEHDKSILVLKGHIQGLKMFSRENRWIREFKLRS